MNHARQPHQFLSERRVLTEKKPFFARHPLTSYLTNTIGWISIFTLLAYRFIPPDMPDGLGSVPIWLMILLAFGMPSIIGIILTALIDGRSRLKALFSHLVQWREPPVMIAAAVLVPLVVYAVAYLLQGVLGGPALVMVLFPEGEIP